MDENIINRIEDDKIAESGVIGSILQSPQFVNHSEFIHPAMFNDSKYSSIYWVVKSLVESGVDEIDDLSIVHKINSNDSIKKFFEEDNIYDIRELINKLKMTATSDVEEYLRRCRAIATIDFKKTMITSIEHEKEYIVNTDDDINDINYHVNNEIMKVGENYLIHNDAPLLGDVVDDVLDKIKEEAENGDIIGHLSKFSFINEYFTYEHGELVVIGGIKKSGKSILLMNEAYHKAKQGIPTLVLDTELSDELYIKRMIALLMQERMHDIKRGDVDEDIYDKVAEEIKELPLAHIYLPKESPNWNFRDLYSFAKLYQQKMDMEFLVFDYIKADTVSSLNVKEHNYLGDLTNALKNDIAGRLNISCLAAAQMSPHEMRVSDSDKINRYASVVAYWIKKHPSEIINDGKKSGTHKFYIDYNRLGKQFDDPECEYINMYADLDRMSVYQAKEQVIDKSANKPWKIKE